jgi:hypothetical protein
LPLHSILSRLTLEGEQRVGHPAEGNTMSAANTVREEFLSLLARCSAAEKAELLAEFARHLFGLHPNANAVPINDRTGHVGLLTRPGVLPGAYVPEQEDPEFWAEIQRRVANPEPCLTPDEVREMFGYEQKGLIGDDIEGNEDQDEEDGKGAA